VEPDRIGNRDRIRAPHGIYRCRDDDTWVALAIDGQADWAAFCEATGNLTWREDENFATEPARRASVDALDLAVEAWTRTRAVAEIVDTLQSAGLAAGPVLRVDQLIDDPQLQARGMVVETDHPVAGRRRQLGLPWTMDSLAVSYRPAPLFGADTHDILTSLLGIDEAEYARLVADNILT